jgi:hypothetical protein
LQHGIAFSIVGDEIVGIELDNSMLLLLLLLLLLFLLNVVVVLGVMVVFMNIVLLCPAVGAACTHSVLAPYVPHLHMSEVVQKRGSVRVPCFLRHLQRRAVPLVRRAPV